MKISYLLKNSARSCKFWTCSLKNRSVLISYGNFSPKNLELNCFKIRPRFFHMSAKRPKSSESVDEVNGDEPESTSRGRKLPRIAEYVNILPSSGVYLQVLQNGNSDYGKCVYLFTDNNRYLFNCPENIGRVMRSMPGFRVGRLQNIFLTHNNWWNIGGLPGVGMTLKQAYVKDVTIHGSKNIELLFKSTNCIYDNEPPIKINEKHYSLGSFEDETFVVDYLPLFGGKKQTMMYKLDNPAGDSKDSNAIDDKNEGSESMDEESREVSVAYICKMKQRPGRMKIAECFKLGIPVGPLLGQLQKGMDVTLPSGKVIQSKDVLEPPEAPVKFAVVDVCDDHFLKSLLNSKGFDDYFYEPESSNETEGSPQSSLKPHLNLIVHFTDALVYSKPEYQKWMQKFGPHTQHLLVNQLAARMPHIDGVYKIEAQLNHINDKVFPLLRCHKDPIAYNEDLQAQIIPAEPFLIYHLRPHKKFQRDPYCQKDMSIDEYVKLLYEENPEFEEVWKNYKQSIGELPATTNGDQVKPNQEESKQKQLIHHTPEEYPELVFLGTSSATASKFRNVSGILLFTSRHQSILMDCGEGAYHQLYELYDNEDLYRVLTTIRLVFISHLHADHHMGLFTLLLKRKEAFDRLNLNFEPVFIVGPMDLFKIQYMYSQYVEDVMSLARRIPSNGEDAPTNMKLAEIKRRFNLRSVSLVKVAHPKSAYGLIIRLRDGMKIVYSGDTLECSRLIDAGRDADLLIHEATLDDTRVKDARAKYHCTVGQAVEVSRKMRAKFTILTHISTRYNTMPLINPDMWEEGKICVAFDFMRYRKSLEPQLGKLLPVLKAAFQRHLEYNLARQDKYGCRLQREQDELKRKLQQELKQQEQLQAREVAGL